MFPQIKKILYATDLTKNSVYAAYFALDLAHKHEAKVLILHCTSRLIPGSILYAEAGLQVIETIKELEKDEKSRAEAEIKTRLGNIYREAGDELGSAYANLITDVVVKQGYPVEEILNLADTEQCDVIVLGTHGKGWLKQTFLGSTARAVLERSRRPIFIIPLPAEEVDFDWH